MAYPRQRYCYLISAIIYRVVYSVTRFIRNGNFVDVFSFPDETSWIIIKIIITIIIP